MAAWDSEERHERVAERAAAAARKPDASRYVQLQYIMFFTHYT